MSTRSFITKKLEDGKYIGVYHHWNGYPEYLGKLLVNSYDTEEKLDKLLSLGDISCAGPIPEDDPKLWTSGLDYESGKCKTYRGRGDTNVGAKTRDLNGFVNGSVDYTYVFENGHWYFYKWTDYKGPVVDFLCGLTD